MFFSDVLLMKPKEQKAYYDVRHGVGENDGVPCSMRPEHEMKKDDCIPLQLRKNTENSRECVKRNNGVVVEGIIKQIKCVENFVI